MKKIPLILLSFCLIIIYATAQTKPRSTKRIVRNTQTPTPIQSVTATKTPIQIPLTPTPAQNIKLAKLEDEVFAELNLLRRNPKGYVKFVEDYLKTFDGKYFRTSAGVALESFEGKKPVEEVIEILKQTEPLSEFKLADGLIKAASDHSQYLVKNNKTGHLGTNGNLPQDRVAIYGTASNGVNENITYGVVTAREIVLTMLVDDGTASRNHRKNILNPNMKYVGLATGENKAAGLHCILDLAQTYFDKK